MIGRLAPVKPTKVKTDDDDDSDDIDGGVPAPVQPTGNQGKRGNLGKILNARPCARCEAKMVERGVRRCYFTLNATTLGVLEYNPE